jgi:hypothetical protein
VTLRATPPIVPPSARRGSDRLTELARRRAIHADALRPAVIIPAVLAVVAVAVIQWWLFTGGTWTGRQPLTVDFANQADGLLHYSTAPAFNPQPILHGPGPAVLLMPFQWALHRGYLDQPISDQCVLLIFTWGIAALVTRWLCRLHTYAAAESPVSLAVAGTLLGSLAVPWPSLLLHSDSTATGIAVAAFFFISGLYVVWSNRCSVAPHPIPLLLSGACWLLAALASPILLPAIVLTALMTCAFALPRRKFAPIAFVVMLLPLAILAWPTLHPATAADWQALAINHVMPNFRYLIARPVVTNWRSIFTTAPHLRIGPAIDPSVLLLQSPLLIALMFGVWGIVRTRTRIRKAAPVAVSAPENLPVEPTVLDPNTPHDPDRILITPRKPTGASLSYTLAIDSQLPPEKEEYRSRITPRHFNPATAPTEPATHRIAPPEPKTPLPVEESAAPAIGRVWLPLTLLAAVICTTFTALLLPLAPAPAFALNTHAAALMLVLVWWSFVARHKTRPAYRLSMSVALALGLLTLFASYLSITLIQG